ncbi:MAG TPA: MmgE/PrpD family protein [Terriglobia bacterium]|nr:MmgE/PrpD family protein [Terriglobia bacterium]
MGSDRGVFSLTRRSLLLGGIAGMTAASKAIAFTREAQQDDKARTVSRPSLSRQLARWVSGLRYEDLPSSVVDRARGLTLHGLASALLGSQSPADRQAVNFITEEEAGVRNGATIMVSDTRATKGGAAFANSEMMLAGGKWDTFRMLTHPGTSIIPAAFVAAETEGASGKDFITGLVAGYEVMERMAADFIPTVMARGFHAGPVFGIFGAAVAAAKILRFTEDQLANTIGLCVNLAGGNLESGGLREGAAVRNAMLAVALAKQGSRSGETALEGNAGFYHAYTGNNKGRLTYSFVGDTQTSLDKITANLGQEWMFLETLYRIYSFAGYNIAHIDVTAKLCEEHNIRYQDVDRVEAVVNWYETQYPSPAFARTREDLGEPRPGSTRYYTAYGIVKRGFPLLGGAADPPEVLDLMKRVTIIPSHQMTLFGPRITIFTRDGKSYTKQATGREFMWDFNEEVRRIREVIPGLPIPAAQFEEIIATCRDLDQQGRAGKLIQLTLKK